MYKKRIFKNLQTENNLGKNSTVELGDSARKSIKEDQVKLHSEVLEIQRGTR